MSQELITIAASVREPGGKSQARKMRRAGQIPAVILAKAGNTNIQLDPKWLHRAYTAEGRVFNLEFGGKTQKAKVHELQLDPVKRVALHVDLILV
jgi:ribosomal protein L25 (general stress protein Ctc)